eukprot:7038223-Heterocapsa_arctica.AAC.1
MSKTAREKNKSRFGWSLIKLIKLKIGGDGFMHTTVWTILEISGIGAGRTLHGPNTTSMEQCTLSNHQ